MTGKDWQDMPLYFELPHSTPFSFPRDNINDDGICSTMSVIRWLWSRPAFDGQAQAAPIFILICCQEVVCKAN